MTTPLSLSLSDVISATVVSAPSGAVLPNVNTIALFTSDMPINAFSLDYKLYSSSTQVLQDFASNSETAMAAINIFAQNPNIMTTGGYLAIIPLQSGETTQAAITRTVNEIFYFGIATTEALTAGVELSALCAYMQSLDKIMVLTSSNASDLNPGGLFDLIRQAGQTHVRGLFYSVSALQARLFGSAYLSRGLSTDFTGSNTAFTMNLKQIANFAADPAVNETVLASAMAAGVDVCGSLGGLALMFTSGANGFFDSVYNSLWFKIAIQIAGLNYLAQTNTKIPLTEKGMSGLKANYQTICDEAVTTGYVAPGSWDSPDFFGNKADFLRNISDKGYYIYSMPVAQETPAQRAARQAPLVQIALLESGAVHSGSIIVEVTA